MTILLVLSLFLFFNYCEREISNPHESSLILPLVSENLSTISISADRLNADSLSSCIVSVIPYNNEGILMGKGMNVKFSSSVGEFTGNVEYDEETGIYSQELQSVVGQTGTAEIMVRINDIAVRDTAFISFYLGIYFENKNLENVIRENLGGHSGPIYQQDLDNISNIDIYDFEIGDVSQLHLCRNLKKLSLVKCNINDLSGISTLSSLVSLNLFENKIENIFPLSSLTLLDTLNLRNNNIANILSISALVNLRSLILTSNYITDISPLRCSNNLIYLELGDNNLSDISAIFDLKNLEQLFLYENQLINIPSMKGLAALEVLDIENNEIKNLDFLGGLTNLKNLFAYSNNINDINSLENLTGLKVIGLTGNNISSIKPLVNNFDLRKNSVIDVRDNPLTSETILIDIAELLNNRVEVRFISNFIETIIRTNLEKESGPLFLDDFMNVTEISCEVDYSIDYTINLMEILICSNLKKITFNGGEISDLTPLSNLKNLETLNIRFNRLESLNGIENITSLTAVNFCSNRLTDISALKYLTGLTNIILSSNNISNLAPLKNLLNLDCLTVMDNNINDISPLYQLTNLQFLYLSNNKIRDIEPLRDMINIKMLFLNDNNILDFKPLLDNPGLNDGDYLYLEHNLLSIESGAYISDLLNRGVDVHFLDEDFENLIRNELDYQTGLIYPEQLLEIKYLFLGNIEFTRPTGIELCLNLESISLIGCKTEKMTAFLNLTKLHALKMHNNKSQSIDIDGIETLTGLDTLIISFAKIVNVEPVTSLSNLVELNLSAANLSDLSFLSNMTNLKSLQLYMNDIRDISPLSNLVRLESLGLGANEICSIEAIEHLTNIRSLDLESNGITDIEPLVDNTGLGNGDNVYLSGNPLNAESINTYIPQLIQRGVTVFY